LARIPASFIDDLLTRTDIVEVIQARVPLKRAGREWTACCPFHDERTPSFTVSPVKQFYHCFGCGVHGSAIGFLMEYDRLEFVDAVEELARRTGLTVPYEGGATRHEDRSDDYSLLDNATRHFQAQLQLHERARAYLEQRGVGAETIERFRLGYAPPGWDQLKERLGGNARPRQQLLLRHGLLIENDAGRSYDRFRDRLMFPILDRRGRPIAFGGRVLSGDDGPKYMNSPETPLFHKGRELFGLHQARQAGTRLPRLIVVEGYMDVIALHQHGCTQVVATLGTATTREQAELLFRNAGDVYFCFDGDRAGRQAAWRAVEAVLPRMTDGRQAWFVFLPEGEDPDSLVMREGLAGFEAHLAAAMPLSTFFFEQIGRDVDISNIDGRARLAEQARPLLAQLPDGVFRDLMLEELTRLTGSSRRPPVPGLSQPGTDVAPGQPGWQRQRRPDVRRSLIRHGIALLMQKPGLAADYPPPYPFTALAEPGAVLLAELMQHCHQRPELNTAAVLEHFSERSEARALSTLAISELPGDEEIWALEFSDVVTRLIQRTDDQQLAELTDKANQDELSAPEKALLRELHQRKSRR